MMHQTGSLLGAALFASVGLLVSPIAAAQEIGFTVQVAPDRAFVPIQSYAVGEVDEHVVFVSGLRGLGMHVFGSNAFPVNVFNDRITVVNADTGEVREGELAHLSADLRHALMQTAPGFIQYDGTLYLYGGYGPAGKSYDTRGLVTAIDLAAVRDAVWAGTPVPAGAFTVMPSEAARTTGPAMVKLANDRFALVGGTNFIGEYASGKEINDYRERVFFFDRAVSMTEPTAEFTMENPGFESPLHRRDVNVLPITLAGPKQSTRAGYVVTSGAFQNSAFMWVNPLIWGEGDEDIFMDEDFIQHQNNYTTARVSLYSAQRGENRLVHFSGLSAFDYIDGEYFQNFFSPWTLEINDILVDGKGFVSETVVGEMPWPVSNSDFVLEHGFATNERGQVLLDELPRKAPVLLGRIYGGIAAQEPGDFPFTYGSDHVYNVFITVIDPPAQHATLTDAVVTFGIVVSGGLAQILESDDTYFRTRSRFGFTALEPNLLDLRIDAVSEVSAPSTIGLLVESRINQNGGTARLRLRNWNTGVVTQVSQYAVGNVEMIHEVTGLNAANFVRAGDGAIELHIRNSVIATFTALGFDSYLDHVAIDVR